MAATQLTLSDPVFISPARGRFNTKDRVQRAIEELGRHANPELLAAHANTSPRRVRHYTRILYPPDLTRVSDEDRVQREARERAGRERAWTHWRAYARTKRRGRS